MRFHKTQVAFWAEAHHGKLLSCKVWFPANCGSEEGEEEERRRRTQAIRERYTFHANTIKAKQDVVNIKRNLTK